MGSAPDGRNVMRFDRDHIARYEALIFVDHGGADPRAAGAAEEARAGSANACRGSVEEASEGGVESRRAAVVTGILQKAERVEGIATCPG